MITGGEYFWMVVFSTNASCDHAPSQQGRPSSSIGQTLVSPGRAKV